ncbi:MAG: hypothetical protein ACK4R6_07935 [Spirosomataceae bacterium]
MTQDKMPAANSSYPKGGVSCSKDSLWLIKHQFFKSSFVVKVPPFG